MTNRVASSLRRLVLASAACGLLSTAPALGQGLPHLDEQVACANPGITVNAMPAGLLGGPTFGPNPAGYGPFAIGLFLVNLNPAFNTPFGFPNPPVALVLPWATACCFPGATIYAADLLIVGNQLEFLNLPPGAIPPGMRLWVQELIWRPGPAPCEYYVTNQVQFQF